MTSLPTGEYGVRDHALIERAYASARAERDATPRTKVGSRDYLTGGVEALSWVLGHTQNAPISGTVLPVQILHISRESDLAESLLRGHLRNERELTQNYLVGAQEALMWVNRECAEPPGYYGDDANT